jgi:hypothetical protein
LWRQSLAFELQPLVDKDWGHGEANGRARGPTVFDTLMEENVVLRESGKVTISNEIRQFYE